MDESRLSGKSRLEQEVDALLDKMTLEEKVAQMVQVPYTSMTKDEALEWAKKGAGSFLHVLGDDARQLQEAALHTRMGIPIIFGIDAIHGHGLNQHATIFPSQLAAACSWDRDMIQKIGRVTAKEVATDGLHWTFSPVLCLGRDTRWGRVDETFGEDPYLAGELGAAIIKGYQGESLEDEDRILACAKHYIGYGEAVGGRDSYDTEMTFRKLREVFLPPFQKAVEAGCATIMTAYGSIDGTPFTVNKKALQGILKDELGFDGFIVTDWNNVNSLVNMQYVAADTQEASKMAAEAGNDMIMTSLEFYDAAIALVRQGEMKETVIDEAVRRLLRMKLRMGLFNHPYKKGKPGCIGCKEHLEINKKAVEETVVLLKNEHTLPLDQKVRKIAVIGPNADEVRAQYGDWTYFTHPVPDDSKKPMRPYVTVYEGICKLAKQRGVETVYHQGCSILSKDTDDIAGAVELAKDCDTIVLVIGDQVNQYGEFKDRADLNLSGAQVELFKQLRKLQVPIVTVLVASKPLCINDVAERSDAFLTAFHGGMFAGEAVAEVLFGEINPCGRLPISFPCHSGQLPVYYNSYSGWHGGKYMDMPQQPYYVFGEGLSYTEYKYSELVIDEKELTVSVNVTNKGEVEGSEVVQLYYNDLVSTVLTPVKQLASFERITLAPKETKKVTFHMKRSDFSLVLPDESRVTESGEFMIMVGHSSKDKDLLSKKIRL